MSTPSTTTYDMTDSQLSSGETSLTVAQNAFDAGKAKLYLSSGAQKYGEEEHTRRLGDLRSTLTATIGATQELTADVIKREQLQYDHLEHGDPFDRLTPDERSAASTAKAFVEEDARRMTASDLVARLRLTLDGGDKATQYLWARYVGQRIQAAASPDAVTSEKANLPYQERQELAKLVQELNTKVRGPEAAKRKEKAAARIARARDIERASRAVFDAAHGREARLMADTLASGRYSI
jgi:hypothetical protein